MIRLAHYRSVLSGLTHGVAFVLLLILASIALVAPVTPVAYGDGEPQYPRGLGEACVADNETMRKQHMDLITHQRDATVIEGIRGEPFSLVQCVACHATKSENGEPVRIDAPGQFCASCHTYAAVKIDCFTCHSAVPDEIKNATPNLKKQ